MLELTGNEIEIPWGPGQHPAPVGADPAAQAAGEEVISQVIPDLTEADPFFATAIRTRLPDGWVSGTKWAAVCNAVEVADIACPTCDDPATPLDTDGMAWITQGGECTESAYAFRIRAGRRMKCSPLRTSQTDVAEAAADVFGLKLGERFTAAAHADTEAATAGGTDPVIVPDTTALTLPAAIGHLLALRKAPGWFTMSHDLVAPAMSMRLLESQGARRRLAGRPVIFGGVPKSGPPLVGVAPNQAPTLTTGQSWLWIHGRVDYDITEIQDRSIDDPGSNGQWDIARQYGIVRADVSCGLFGVPVSVS